MRSQADVVVAGGGLIGLASAYALRRAGAEVVLVDPQVSPPPASFGNAGHIATEQVEPLASLRTLASAPRRLFAFGGALDLPLGQIGAWGPWALRHLAAAAPARFAAGRRALGGLMAEAMPAWRRLAQRLEAPELLKECGHLVVWESPASAAAGFAAWRATDIGTARVRPMDAAELTAVATGLGRALAGGARFEGTGQVSDSGEVLRRLEKAFTEMGGRTLRARVMGLERTADAANLVLDSGERLEPGLILVAAGVGSAALMRQAGHAAPLIAERGYHIEGPAAGWGDRPPIVFEDRSMIVTRFGERLRASSIVEFARPGAPADPRKWARLRRHAAELGLPLAEPMSQWMGARPTLPDYLPAIGRSRRAPNLAYAFGHQHLGLTLAAITSEMVAALAAGEEPPAAFDIERFASARGRRGAIQETV